MEEKDAEIALLREQAAKRQAALEIFGRELVELIPEHRAGGDVVEHATSCAVAFRAALAWLRSQLSAAKRERDEARAKVADAHDASAKPIYSWDPKVAAKMARSIVERYGATPYGFRFETRIVADPIPDGQGGTLHVESKVVATSGMFYLDGTVETFDEIESRADPREEILRSNMRINGWPLVCKITRSYRTTRTFEEADVVVSNDGEIVARGDDPKHVEYRRATTARWDAEWNAEHRMRTS